MLPLTVDALHVSVHIGTFLIIQNNSDGIGYGDFRCNALLGEGNH